MSSKKYILLVDDDVQFVETVQTLLDSAGYSIATAYETTKGLELAKQKKPDLILLDVMFAGRPGPDGFEISRELKKDAQLKDVPIIIISGVRKVFGMNFKYEPDEQWMPVKSFLDKPVKPDKLLSEIKKILG